MLRGTAQQRVKAVFTLCSWFAMGAFVASTLEYHLDFKEWTEKSAAVWGGSVAALTALLIKSV
jgi:hypothetical protein